MNFRLLSTLFLFCLLPLAPWWLLVILAGLALIIFPNYWEALVIFFIYDLAFGLPSGWLGTQFTFTVIFAILYLLVTGVRDKFIFSGS
jgi:hypothetical protein